MTTDTAQLRDLIERLRDTGSQGVFEAIKNGRYASPHEAADELDRLRADLDIANLALSAQRLAEESLRTELAETREELAAAYVKLSGKGLHASDCATSNAPAMKPEPTLLPERPDHG